MKWNPSFECHVRPDGEHVYRIGHQLIDEFLEFVVGRARPNTVRAYAHDLSVFFSVVNKDPLEVRPKDVMAFVTAQRRPKPGAENVVRIADGSSGLSGATIKRRLAAVSSFYGYLITRDDVDVTANPVPRGIATRQSRSRGGRGLPLVRGVRRLPRILDPDEIDALMGALRTERDRAMTQAMVLGGLRRCEVLGLLGPPPRARRRSSLRPAHRASLRGQRRQAGGGRSRPSAPVAPHPGHPVHQPEHEPRSHRRLARASLHGHDPGLCAHLR